MNAILTEAGYPSVAVGPQDKEDFAATFRNAIDKYRQKTHEATEIEYETFGSAQRG